MMELKKATLALVGMARNEGAEGAEAWIRRRRTTRCTSEGGGVSAKVLHDASIRVRLVDGRQGQSSGRIHGIEGTSTLLSAALASAQSTPVSTVDVFHLDIATMGLGTLDRRQALLTDEDRLDVVRVNHKAMSAAGVEVCPVRVVYTEELQEVGFASTGGIEAEDRSSRFTLTAEAYIRENSSRRVLRTLSCRTFADACSQPLGAGVGKSVMAMCSQAEIPEQPCTVVFSQAVMGLLLPKLLPAFEHSRLESGKSFLSARLGSPQGSSLVHITDDATTPGGLQTRPFDGRGVPPVPVPLWVEGVPTGRYLGVNQAVAAGLRPSGHEGLDGQLWVGNVVVRPGSRSRNMLFPDLGELVLCTELLGSRVDLKTGTLGLKLRCFTHDSDGGSYIGDLDMKTDVTSLLGSVIHLASDQERHGFVDTPTWILKGPWFQ